MRVCEPRPQVNIKGKPYLERNGTALNKFRMNQASVLDAGLIETKGGWWVTVWNDAFLCFGLRLICANELDNSLGSVKEPSDPSLTVSYSL